MAVQLEAYSKDSDIIKLEMGDLPASSLAGYVLSFAEAERLETALCYWLLEVKRHGYPPERILVDNSGCAHIQCRKEDCCA